MRTSFVILLYLSFAFVLTSQAQEKRTPPIPVELLMGHRAIQFQAIVSRPISVEKPKWSYFGLTTFSTEYNNVADRNEFAALTFLNYGISKHWKLAAGGSINQKTGFFPSLGINYTWANPTWLVVAFPRVDLTGDNHLELFGLTEFKPQIKPDWRMYNRVQVMYLHNPTEGNHARSFVQLRTGIQYKNFQVGLGYTADWYGPMQDFLGNAGVFGRVEIP